MIPAILHIDPVTFQNYSPGMKSAIKNMLQDYIAYGWAGPGPSKKPNG